MQTVQILMRRLVTSRLIRIDTVCHSVLNFRQKPWTSKYKGGRVHSRNSGTKGSLQTQNQDFKEHLIKNAEDNQTQSCLHNLFLIFPIYDYILLGLMHKCWSLNFIWLQQTEKYRSVAQDFITALKYKLRSNLILRFVVNATSMLQLQALSVIYFLPVMIYG